MALSAELKRFMDSLACCTYNGAQHSDVLVEETDVLAKLRKVRLQVGGGDWFSFCPDKGRDEKSRMSALLTAGKGMTTTVPAIAWLWFAVARGSRCSI